MKHPPVAVWIIVGIAVTYGLVRGYRVHVQERTRTEELRQLAEVLGFTFEGNSVLSRRFGEFEAFRIPYYDWGRNIMTGSLTGQLVTAMDVQYSKGPSYKTLVFFPAGAKGLPDFQLSDGAIKALFRRHVAFLDPDGFSDHYTVYGADEAAIQRAFSAKTRAFFVANQGWSVETRGGAAVVLRESKRVAPADVSAFLADALKVLDAFGRR